MIFELKSSTEDVIIYHIKTLFSRYGRCDRIRTDGGPQFQRKFKQFANEYNFSHIPSSPYYSQSNGEVESAVKVAKSLIDKNEDILDALLEYRSTPLSNGYSPAELLMGRKLKNCLPTCPSQLTTPISEDVIQKEKELKSKQIINYNKRHKVVELKPLTEGQEVWITWKYGIIYKENVS